MAEDKKEIIEFNCPACGSDDRLAGSLAEKVKKAGWMREDLNYYLDEKAAIVSDPAKELAKPIGSTSPAFRVYFDVCRHCGCYYAAKMEIMTVTKTLPQIPRMGPPRFSMD